MNLKIKICINLLLTICYIFNFSYCFSKSINDDYVPIISLSFPNHPVWKNWRFVAYQEKGKREDYYLLSKPAQLRAISTDESKKFFSYIAHDNRYDYSYLRGESVQPFIFQMGVYDGSYPDTILFTPIFSAGGSGEAQLIALLLPDMKKAKWENLLPEMYITNLGEWQFLKCPLLSRWKVLVTADFIFKEGETHYSSHKYHICLYTYSEKEHRYKILDEYKTEEKYNSLEGDIAPIASVIEQEIQEIILRLKRVCE